MRTPDSPAPPGLRILLVEDHAATQRILIRILEGRGHRVTPAASLATARALAAAHLYDLLISDIGLPDGTGHTLMAEFQIAHGIPGIALSGYGAPEDIRNSLAAGFTTHLTKPIQLAALEQAIAASYRQP